MDTYNGYRPTSHLYEYARLQFSEGMKKRIRDNKFTPHSPKNSIWVKNSDKCKRVFEDEIDEYIKNGWVRGRIIKSRKNQTEETRKKMSEAKLRNPVIMTDDLRETHRHNSSGRVWIHDTITKKHKFVKEGDVDDLLSNGWVKGDKRSEFKSLRCVDAKVKGELNEEKNYKSNR
jgi:hypothetical protein